MGFDRHVVSDFGSDLGYSLDEEVEVVVPIHHAHTYELCTAPEADSTPTYNFMAPK